MNAKLAQLRRMLDEGYTIDDIREHATEIEAILVRRGTRATVRLDRTAAQELLYRDAWRGRRSLWSR